MLKGDRDMNNNVYNNLVFFTQEGKTYYGIARAGQFIEYNLSVSHGAYGHDNQMILTLSGEVLQDSPDDVSVDQHRMVVQLIKGLLEEKGDFTFYSKLYHGSVIFKRGDDIFDIVAKLQELKESYGDGKIY